MSVDPSAPDPWSTMHVCFHHPWGTQVSFYTLASLGSTVSTLLLKCRGVTSCRNVFTLCIDTVRGVCCDAPLIMNSPLHNCKCS